jgi:hypothetical protein
MVAVAIATTLGRLAWAGLLMAWGATKPERYGFRRCPGQQSASGAFGCKFREIL